MSLFRVFTAATIALITAAMPASGGTRERGAATAPMCVAPVPAPLTHVRPVTQALSGLVQDGVRRSPTLAALVDRIEASDGIVFLQSGELRRAGVRVRGGMTHAVTKTTYVRIVRISIESEHGDATIGTIAHELRHALEVLDDAGAVDRHTVGLLYTRIGYRVGPGRYETDAAQTAERQVIHELGRCRP
jgi:hypothetical protein